jgi:hypothetical protein
MEYIFGNSLDLKPGLTLKLEISIGFAEKNIMTILSFWINGVDSFTRDGAMLQYIL